MRHRVLYQDKSLEIRYDLVRELLFATWTGPQTEDSMMAGYEQILTELRNHGAKGLLDNHTDLSGLWSGASEWVAKEWFPEAQAAGLRIIGTVFSSHKFSNLSTAKTIDLMNSPFVKGFENPDVAEKWIESMTMHRGA